LHNARSIGFFSDFCNQKKFRLQKAMPYFGGLLRYAIRKRNQYGYRFLDPFAFGLKLTSRRFDFSHLWRTVDL